MIRHLIAPHHRARVLALLGIIWIGIGVGILVQPPRQIGVIYEALSLEARAAVWCIPGAVGLIASIWRRWDSWAWVLLIIPPAERGFGFLWGWVTNSVHAAYLGFGVYAALGMLVYECAAGLDRIPDNGEAPCQERE